MLYPVLENACQRFHGEFDKIPASRQSTLAALAHHISEQLNSSADVKLTFICTHNSRRSQMAQIWAQAATTHFGIDRVQAYSGGTEVNAFSPRAVAAMQRAGFRVTRITESDNPVYEVHHCEAGSPLTAFSKIFDQPPNPEIGYGAVMTCSQADAACPIVPGASWRLALPYDDPKDSDGTTQERAQYDTRCHQIGREILYAFSLVNR